MLQNNIQIIFKKIALWLFSCKRIILILLYFTIHIFMFSEGQQITEEVYAINPSTTLDVINHNGSVTITGENRNDIVVTTKKISWAWQGKDEVKKVSIDVNAVINTNKTIIKTNYQIDEEKVFVYLEIKVPLELKINSIICNNGFVNLYNVAGQINIISNNGSINCTNIVGSIKAETNNGDVLFDNITGSIDISISSGKMFFKKIIGDVFATLNTGRIIIDDINGSFVTTVKRGDVEISNINGNIDVNIVIGSIDIKQVVGNAKAVISSGQIKIRNINGYVDAFTENGGINIWNAKSILNCKTINGAIIANVTGINENGSTLTTENGDINIQFSENINASLEILNPRGKISLPSNTKISGKEYNKVSGILGSDGPKLFISTKNGAISLRN